MAEGSEIKKVLKGGTSACYNHTDSKSNIQLENHGVHYTREMKLHFQWEDRADVLHHVCST